MSSSILPQRIQEDHTVMTTSYDQSPNQTENYSDGLINDLQRTQQIRSYTFAAGVLPLSVLGFVLNCISFCVWHCSKKHKPVVWLFQYLAVWDNLLLITFFIQGVLYLSDLRWHATFFSLLSYLTQAQSVLTTLFISVIRWFSVFRRQLYQRITGYHVVVTCVFVTVCSVVLTSFWVYSALVSGPSKAEVLAVTSLAIIVILFGNTLVLALLVVNLALLRAVCTHRQSLKGRGSYWKTTLAVLCISGCSLLAYPVSFLADMMISMDGQFNPLTSTAVDCTGMLLKVLNSSINFIFYFFVATSFRSLLKGYLYRLERKRCCPWKRSSSIVSSPPALPLDIHPA